MGELILTTYDWVPMGPRGYVRDVRIRWALEEAGLPYRVASTPFRDRGAEHLEHQPFAQVPWLQDGDLSIFESGAILLHLGEKSPALLPTDPKQRSLAIQWLISGLNSVEMATVPWSVFMFSKFDPEAPAQAFMEGWVDSRLGNLERVLTTPGWLAGTFSVADIMMTDVLRLMNRFDKLADYPACRSYLQRAEARPAFKKAVGDQLAHFARAD